MKVTTGAEMHPMAKATVKTGMICVEVGDGYYEIYIDKEIQKSANNGETRCYTVEPGNHRVSAYSAGQMVLDETVHVPAEGEAVPEPEQPAEEPKLPEEMTVKTQDVCDLIAELRDLADFLTERLPKPEAAAAEPEPKAEPAPEE